LIELIKTLQPAEKRALSFVVVGITVSALLDVAGIASVVPFLALIANPNAVSTMKGVAGFLKFIGVSGQSETIVVVGLASLLVIVAASALNAWVTWGQVRLTNMVGFTMSRRLLHAYLSQPLLLLTNRNTAELGKNILSEVDRGVSGAMTPALTLVSRSAAAVFICIFLLFVEPVLALVLALIFGGVYGLIFLRVRRLLSRMGASAVEDNNQRFRIVAETFGALRELRLYGRLAAFVRRFDEPARRYARVTATSLLIGQIPKFVLEPLAFAAIVLTVLYTMRSGADLATVFPLIGLFAFAGYRLMPAFQNIFVSFSALRFYLPSLRVILDGLTTERAENGDVAPTLPKLEFKDGLVFENVSFVYPDRSCVLEHLNLAIKANTTVGLIGKTGSGKTTLLSLILGLTAPTSGRISVDGNPLGGERLAAWQRGIGYVPQDVYLLDDTVAANIALGVPADEVDNAMVRSAARLANIDRFITESLPQGYATIVGERGSRLSGGQRQRIGIARALYHDPNIVIFDEATSGLDAETESAIMSAIDSLAGHRTLIIVSHRAPTLRRADQVHLLDERHIVASGPLDRFAALFSSGEIEEIAPARSPP
jgi:ABC-type bacteriocin/lantibiotic exporter with double-glycine peptidase domain